MNILIFGSPRSGTTWLGKIFDSHPDVRYLHEPEISLGSDLPHFPSPNDFAHLVEKAESEVSSWLSARHLRVHGTRPVVQKRNEGLAQWRLRQGRIYLGKGLEKAIAQVQEPWGVRDPWREEAPFTVIKTVNMLSRAGLLMQALPRGRCVYVVRHPCGHIASVLRAFRSGVDTRKLESAAVPNSPLGQREGLTVDGLRALPDFELLAWRWAAFNDAAYRQLKDNPRAEIVYYEDMTGDPLGSIRAMFDKLGVPWDGSVEGFIASSTEGSGGGGHYSLKRDPQAAAQRWRRELGDEEVERIAEICRRSEIGARVLDAAERSESAMDLAASR